MSQFTAIGIVTGTRAEYGLLRKLITAVHRDRDWELRLMVTGMHLSPEFGLTYREIEADGLPISSKVEMLLSGDSPAAVAKSVGLGVAGFAEVFGQKTPDLLVVLGDRYEILAAVTAALMFRIPVAHIHGGEVTRGVIDEAIRHSVTKMSHLHFTATAEYRKRVIQLGESPDRVFHVGGLGVDALRSINLMRREELEASLGFALGEKSLLVTFHPVTLEVTTAERQLSELLAAMAFYIAQGGRVIFTKPNADTDGRAIIGMIDRFVEERPDSCRAYASLGQLRYLSALQFVEAVVGNSSSGLAEAPSFKVATIDIGDRQLGRMRADSVLHCGPVRGEIQRALDEVSSPEFRRKLESVVNPYGEGGATERILAVLKGPQPAGLIKKVFHDIEETVE